jgi:Mrp family chromosome partitioning ATPase
MTEVQNLWVVPYGGDRPNAALPEAPTLRSFIDRAKREFEYVIVDAPGCATHSVALLLAPAVDCTLFVVRAGYTRREAAAEAIGRLRHVRPDGWGIVLNAQRYYVPGFIYRRL